jgi:hypothetical protein
MLRMLFIAAAVIFVAACVHRRLPDTPAPFDYIPARWVDLPDAPFVAQVRGTKALLVARSKDSFTHIEIGCVRPLAGRTDVVAAIVGIQVSDGVFGPGWPVETPFNDLNNPEVYAQLDSKKRCPADSYFAIVRAGGLGPEWNAEGGPWPNARR